MALWFPLMVNSTQIGTVEIIRRDEDETEVGYTYDWTVTRFRSTGLTKCLPETKSGALNHLYDDGAFALVQKVLEDYASA